MKWATLGRTDVKVAQNHGANLREKSVWLEATCLWPGADFLTQNDGAVSGVPLLTPHCPCLVLGHPLQSLPSWGGLLEKVAWWAKDLG